MPEENKKAVAEAVEKVVEHAPKKDVGFLVKAIGVAIFIIAVGIAVSFVLYGKVTVITDVFKSQPAAVKDLGSSGETASPVVSP